ncbi:hypothetical protein EH220_04130 [bacterium]|nr:MAG: hypothetical protein EH220_04130 [bacterium]
MNRLLIILLLIIGICATASADSNRVLLRPPDNYDGINIGGVPFVMGQVYLPQLADTALLTPFGFRDFQFAGSTSRYKKIKAWWPLNTDVAELPEQVLGLSYEKMTEEDLAYAAIMQPDLIPSGKSPDEIKSLRYSQMRPSDGRPHLIYKDQPYVEGQIYCSSEPDEEALKSIGVILLYDFGSDDARSIRHGYTRWSAMWPMTLKESRLPEYIVGMIADNPMEYYDDYAADSRDFRNYCTPPSTTNYYYYGSGYTPPHYYRQSSLNNKYGYQQKVNWTPAQRNNPQAYWYNTVSRTTLEPTAIGSYRSNRSLLRVSNRPCYHYHYNHYRRR